MRKIAKKLSAVALCTVFATMQIASAAIDTGLGNAVIDSTQGGFAGIDKGTNSATLKFNDSAHVNWDRLNVGSGETLNFNAIDGAKNLTIVNTVTNGMTNIAGKVTSNDGIAKLIISNPNGMLFDGASFTTAGDLSLTTQALSATYANGNLDIKGLDQVAINGVTIKNSDFTVGGEFNITAPTIEAIKAAVKANGGFKLITADGQNYLVKATPSENVETETAVRLESISVDGKVYIVADRDIVKVVNGGTFKNGLEVESDGNVALNYVNNGEKLNVTGDVKVVNDGRISYLRNAKVTGNVDMSNSGGFLEVKDVDVTGNVDLKTTVKSNDAVKHFVHVVGTNNIGGNLNVDSIHNIHIGGYEDTLTHLVQGELNVGGNINALAREGSIAVTVDTSADKVAMTSGTLNIISNGKAVVKANEYDLKAAHYIGGVDSEDVIINTMENYLPIDVENQTAYFNVGGGKITGLEAKNARVRSIGDLNVTGVNAGDVKLSSTKDIVIGKGNKADLIEVDGETRNLTVENPANSRDYVLKYTNIKDTKVITINPDEEITYEKANGPKGWNKGKQTKENTYLVVPGEDKPVTPPADPEVNTDDNENVKILRNLTRDPSNAAIDAGQVYTPIAFAADLEDEIETGVRKNVDGSVTVVRPFTPSK